MSSGQDFGLKSSSKRQRRFQAFVGREFARSIGRNLDIGLVHGHLLDATASELANNAMTSCDSARYASMRGLTNMPSGHSRLAVMLGMADRTPNRRAYQ